MNTKIEKKSINEQVILCLNCGAKWRIDKGELQEVDIVTARLEQCPLCFAERLKELG